MIVKLIPQNDSLYYSVDFKIALKDALAVILVTPWPDYIKISPQEFK
jgi:UDPglucose 6-dehydrogenase